jgi:hypothetical protein
MVKHVRLMPIKLETLCTNAYQGVFVRWKHVIATFAQKSQFKENIYKAIEGMDQAIIKIPPLLF